MDGHGNNVTLETIEQAKDIGLNMITLPSHTSHALQPLDVFCFKPFKITLKKDKGVAISRNNHQELDEITLADWVDQALEQSLSTKNIKFEFRTTSIWPITQRQWIATLDH